MEVFIYFPPNLGMARDEIEDALDDALGEVAEITGGGSGKSGSKIDLAIDDRVSAEKALEMLRAALRKLRISSAKIVINGRDYQFG